MDRESDFLGREGVLPKSCSGEEGEGMEVCCLLMLNRLVDLFTEGLMFPWELRWCNERCVCS